MSTQWLHFTGFLMSFIAVARVNAQLPDFQTCAGANRSVQFTLVSSDDMKQNWTAANQFCQRGGSTFRLAVPQSQIENECISNLSPGKSMPQWAFLGRSSTYQNFYNSSSSGNCPAMSFSTGGGKGGWLNVSCNQYLPFVCERVLASRCDFSDEDDTCPFLSFRPPDGKWETAKGQRFIKTPPQGANITRAAIEFLVDGILQGTEFPCNVSLEIKLDNKTGRDCQNGLFVSNANKQQNMNLSCGQWTTLRWTLLEANKNGSNSTSPSPSTEPSQSQPPAYQLLNITLAHSSVVFIDNATATCSSRGPEKGPYQFFNVTYTCMTNTTMLTSQASCNANRTCTVTVKETCLNVTSCSIQASGLGSGQALGVNFMCKGNNTFDPLPADCFTSKTPQSLSPCLGRCERLLQSEKIAGQVVRLRSTDDSTKVWRVTCDDGFETDFKKTTNVTCNATAERLIPSAICTPVKCSSSPLVGNSNPLTGAHNKSLFSFGEKVNASCSLGYWLKLNNTYEESATFQCISGGVWQPSLACEAYCTNPNEDLSNVMVSRSQTRLPSETSVEYNCSKLGQAINGSITTESWTATCQANGQWDELLPCTDIRCPALVGNLTIELSTHKSVYGTLVVVTCKNRNHSIAGGLQTEVKLQCTEQGQWNGTVPTCVAPPTTAPATTTSTQTTSTPTPTQPTPASSTNQTPSTSATTQTTSATTAQTSASTTATTSQATSPPTTIQTASRPSTSQTSSPMTTSNQITQTSLTATSSQPTPPSSPSRKPTREKPTASQTATSPLTSSSMTTSSDQAAISTTQLKETSSGNSSTTSIGGADKKKSDDNNGVIIGAAAGGAVVLLILVLVVIILWKKRSSDVGRRKPSLRNPNNRRRSDEVRLSGYRKSPSSNSSLDTVAESSPGGHEDTYSRLEHSEQTFGLKKSVSDTVVPNNKLGNRPGRTSTTSVPSQPRPTNDTYAHLDRRSGTSQIIGGTSTFMVNQTSEKSAQDDKGDAYSEVVTTNKSKKESAGQSDGAPADYESVRPSVPTKTDGANVLYEENKPGAHSAEGGQSKVTTGANALPAERSLDYAELELAKPSSPGSSSAPPKQVTEYSTVVVDNPKAES